MATKLTLPLKYHGGKHYLAKRIVALMPPHLHYVEPYFGGGSVLLAHDPARDWFIDDAWRQKHGETVPAKLRGCSEVVNDIDGELTNFWESLRLCLPQLIADLRVTPFSQRRFEYEKRNPYTPIGSPDWRAAVSFFIRCRQSLAGRMDTFAPLSKTRTRRRINEQASAWLNAIEGLPAVSERLKPVVILTGDAIDVIRQQDGEKTLFYCDPTYLKETRTAPEVYRHEMTREDHEELLLRLDACQGKFLLSGYRSDLYDAWAKDAGWRRVDFDLPNHAAGGNEKRRMTECVWMNFDPSTAKDAG